MARRLHRRGRGSRTHHGNRGSTMTEHTVSRRTVFHATAGAALLAAGVRTAGVRPAWAEDKSITVGVNLSLTGADAESAKRIFNGAAMAFDEINAKGGVNGYK